MPIQDPLTQQIIGLCHRIANTLGHGFAEKVYENAQGLNHLRATGLPTCLLINFGKAKIEVRRLGMSPGKGTGEMELEVKDIQ